MAREVRRPGRTLVGFFVGLAIAYGLVAVAGTWTPTLGLDLQGGTRITLVAEDSPSEESLTEAAGIIDQRVNGSGVSEAEVTTQGSQFVVVEVPGQSRRDLVETVERQAQLRFRLVACTSADGRCGPPPEPPTQEQPTEGPRPGPGVPATRSAEPSDGADNRPPVGFAGRDRQGDRGSPNPSPNPSGSASPAPSSPSPEAPAQPAEPRVEDPLVWIDSPDEASVQAFHDYQCPPPGEAELVEDDPDQPLVTCDDQGIKYLLSTSMIEGTDLQSADAGIPQQRVDWAVTLDFDGDATRTFADISRSLVDTGKQFAIVLDGQVISAPTMNSVITNGQAEITGNFTESEALSLATSLRYGALPIAFEPNPPVETVGPSLAGNQLSAGLLAGGIGLLLVMVYCLFYYRGLGVVVIASLVVAAAATYALVLLLSETAGFAVSLPGIAGLIVAVGITADSFIVYFERIRDEMRDGKSMRSAAESGWVRARNTCLAADAVSLLAAVVLYIFAAGVVKGFAFALGLSTLIDLAVFFWFTHPMVSWLARFRFFGAGHRLSGLSAETLGIDRLPRERATVGGRA
ncbi:MAG TPA: protein translocase subunit SecD [Nocardioides sp.]|nr:protein translocase subunit SecD [Nocardioides sp.]